MRRIMASLAAALIAAAAAPLDGAGPEAGVTAGAIEPSTRLTVDDAGAQTAAIEASPRGALRLTAALSGGGPQLAHGVTWILTGRATGAVVLEASGGALDVALPPGRYVAEAVWTGWRDGAARRGRTDLNITADSTTVREIAIDLALRATVTAPAATRDGDLIAVEWSGPDNAGLRIEVAAVGAGSDAAVSSRPVVGAADGASSGSGAARLQAPSTPGAYEVRLVLDAPDLAGAGVVLARTPLDVTAYDYALEAPAAAEAGERLAIGWRGPGHPGDIITLVRAGDPSTHDPERSTPARSNPAEIALPDEPGIYELRYVSAAQRQIKSVREIEVGAGLGAL
jgi:hypothetical protein